MRVYTLYSAFHSYDYITVHCTSTLKSVDPQQLKISAARSSHTCRQHAQLHVQSIRAG